MNSDDRTLSDQAIQWRVRLQADDVTDEDRLAFERWKNQSAGHRASYEQIDALWQNLEAPSHLVWEELRQDHEPAETLSPFIKPLRWKRPAFLAASIALIVLGGFWLSINSHLLNPNTISAARGERVSQTLPDGSTIHLNTKTTVSVEFTDVRRRIVLEEGEAWFTVTPDSTRPFVVEAGVGTTRAVGTEFNIRREKDEATVTVIEGTVNVSQSPPGSEGQPSPVQAVTAGEQVRYNPRTDMSDVAPANLVQVTGWRRGQLVFDLEPLGEVVEEVDRYWAGKILVMDGELRDHPISGVFQTGDPDAVVQAIVKTFNVNSVKVAGYLYVLYQ